MDWESRSWVAWWEEDGAAAIEAREHAYRGFKAAGDRRGAARMALWLGLDHLEFRGELGGEARELGRSLDLVALEMMGLATEGLAMVEQGEVRSGMRCLDEASAAALGGEYEEASRSAGPAAT